MRFEKFDFAFPLNCLFVYMNCFNDHLVFCNSLIINLKIKIDFTCIVGTFSYSLLLFLTLYSLDM